MQDPNPYAPPLPSPEYSYLPPAQYVRAGKGARFLNFLIDSAISIVLATVVVTALILIVGGMSETALDLLSRLIYVLVFVIYAALMEGFCGRTIGKLITGTKAVQLDGSKISWGQAIGRSFCRFIPFEMFSALGETPWHDSIPKTQVVRIRGANAIQPAMPAGRAPVRPPVPPRPPVSPQ